MRLLTVLGLHIAIVGSGLLCVLFFVWVKEAEGCIGGDWLSIGRVCVLDSILLTILGTGALSAGLTGIVWFRNYVPDR